MSTDQTTNIGLPYLMPAQAQKHVTVNESLTRLDALVQTGVVSRSVSSQPGSPADGEVWICPTGKTGPEWGGYANGALAYYRDGVWEQLQPKAGWRAWVADEGAFVAYDGAAWATVAAPPSAGFRNAVINGGFDIWQRGASFSGTGFTADRWSFVLGGGTATVSRQAFAEGDGSVSEELAYFFRLAFTGAPASTPSLTHRIEDVRTFAGATVTLSFYARSPSDAPTGPITVRLRQNFGSGGSGVANTDMSFTPGASWARHVFSFALPSLSGETLGTSHSLDILFLPSVLENFDLDLAGVQLERGGDATALERRPAAVERMLCRRYFERIAAGAANVAAGAVGWAETATQARLHLPFAEKRIAPSIMFSGFAHFDIHHAGASDALTSSIAAADITPKACRVVGAFSASTLTPGEALALRFNSASGAIDIDAEL